MKVFCWTMAVLGKIAALQLWLNYPGPVLLDSTY